MIKQPPPLTQPETVTMQKGAMKWQAMAVAFTITGFAILLLH